MNFVFLSPTNKAVCVTCERYLAVVVDPDDPSTVKEYVCVLCDHKTPAKEVNLCSKPNKF